MCLLQTVDKKQPCNHEECKAFEQLNLCKYSQRQVEANAEVVKEPVMKMEPETNPTRIFESELFKKLKVNGEVNMLDQMTPKTETPPSQTPVLPQNIKVMPMANQQNKGGFNMAYSQSIMSYLKSNNMGNMVQHQAPLNAGFKPATENPTQQAQQSQQQQLTINSMYNLLISQNKVLNDLKERNDVLHDTLGTLIGEVNTLKTMIYKTTINGQMAALSGTSTYTTNSQEVATQDNVLALLYPTPQQFTYQLVIKGEFPSLLYRERNFRFEVELIDLRTNTRVENPNKIPLTMSVYSSEVPPKLISVNTSGNKVIKGTSDAELLSGTACFEKVQVNEVTSHFRNGWVFIVIAPKITANLSSISLLNAYCGGLLIDPMRIKPLIFDKIVVKAKKAKEASGN